MDCEPLKKLIREVPDFPKPGILFYDITTLLKDKAGFAQLIDGIDIIRRKGRRRSSRRSGGSRRLGHMAGRSCGIRR